MQVTIWNYTSINMIKQCFILVQTSTDYLINGVLEKNRTMMRDSSEVAGEGWKVYGF